MEQVRITPTDLELIKVAFKKHFSTQDHLWLFGSRVDLKKRGGDLDFYIETMESASTAVDKKMAFVSELWQNLGDQKIDVVLNLISSPYALPIYKVAKETGIQLV